MLNTDQIKMNDIEIKIAHWNEIIVGKSEHSCNALGKFVRKILPTIERFKKVPEFTVDM